MKWRGACRMLKWRGLLLLLQRGGRKSVSPPARLMKAFRALAATIIALIIDTIIAATMQSLMPWRWGGGETRTVEETD